MVESGAHGGVKKMMQRSRVGYTSILPCRLPTKIHQKKKKKVLVDLGIFQLISRPEKSTLHP